MRRILLSIAQCQVLRRICLVLALLLIALIFGMADSSLATGSLNFQPPLDKLLHAGVYGTIAALLWSAGILRSRIGLWLLVVGIGILDELQQRSITGRESSLHDLLADMVGVTLGLWLAGCVLSWVLVRRSE
jgi:VanZ family protein